MKDNTKILASIGLASALSACAVDGYVERPLQPDQTFRAFQSRSVAAPGLRDFMVGHGQTTWPIQSWGLTELTLLALYFNPELRVAQAEARVAASHIAVAGPPRALAFTPRAEHHSGGGSSGPWSIGIALDFPVGQMDRRAAASTQAARLAQAAEFNVGVLAWRIRHDLRTALLERVDAEQAMSSFAEEASTRSQLLHLLERRRDLGLISNHEPAVASLQLLESGQLLAQTKARALEATHRLAAVVGLPASTMQQLQLSFTDVETASPIFAQAAREALLNRVDLRRKLMEFAAADAAVKLAVANQVPEISLAPGFLWDQGDNVWSLAANILLPRDHSPLIVEANARRELAAQEFIQLQAQVINDAEAAAILLRLALEQIESFDHALQGQQQKFSRVTQQFNAGYADQVDLAEAKIQTFSAVRNLAQARFRARKAAAVLEDIMQRPLSGFPLTHEEIINGDLAQQ